MGRVKKPKEKEVYKPTDKQVGEGAYYNLREIKGYNDGRNKMDKFRKQELTELADWVKIQYIINNTGYYDNPAKKIAEYIKEKI